MNQPSNRFTGAPDYGSRHPGPTPASGAGYAEQARVPSPAPMPTMKLTPKGVLHLHQSLVAALGISPSQPINLRPPEFDSAYWHLDLRPDARCKVVWYRDQRPRVLDIRLPEGLVLEPLTLHLLPGKPPYENYYPLIASNAFAT